ncbi:NAD-dependent aldehyde dehydrogenase [Trametes maxima]|nr:NAD-dependent aldehyde dehydrogenase [Trametes maxima]
MLKVNGQQPTAHPLQVVRPTSVLCCLFKVKPRQTCHRNPERLSNIPKIHERARQAFSSGKTKSISFRKEQIAQVGYLVRDNEEPIINSLKLDLGRPAHETISSDLQGVYTDVSEAYHNVENWVQPYSSEFQMPFAAMCPRLKAEPKGTTLILSPFNYPLVLSLSPLYLDNDLYHVVNGGIHETTKVLELQWDHIFYVGSGRVGRVVAEAAAKHLTPCTLEPASGKNPVVVDSHADLKLVAKRVLWGKFTNAGQVCLAPDYLIIERGLQDALIAEIEDAYRAFYPEGPAVSDSFGRIVSEAHTARIEGLLNATEGRVALGGDVDVPRKYVAPTILRDVGEDDALMKDGVEIFGPVLPIVPVDDINESIRIINARSCPLAVYVFSPDEAFQNQVFNNTQSGAAVANDTVINASIPGLPIGGVGASGYGYYTGKHGFDQFTHLRVFSDNPAWTDGAGFGTRYPPYKQVMLPPPTLPPRPAAGNVSSKSAEIPRTA